MFQRVTPAIFDELRAIVDPDHVLTDRESMEKYSHDETEDLVYWPEVVVRPRSTDEVSRILALATRERIPVTPRGAGTGLSGGALPVHGGIVLSVERMNRILEIDTENLFAVVEPGVITERLQDEVEKLGLFYAPDPASRGSSFMGGNVAHGSGGPRAVKYGVTKDWVCGLEAVLPSGEVIRTGGKLIKNVTGYNLTQLLIGSEGTLAVVTEITVRLMPLARHRRTLLAPFDDLRAAARAVSRILRAAIVPCAIEYMESAAMKAAERWKGIPFPNSDAPAQLLIEVDGPTPAELDREIEVIGEVCQAEGAGELLLAETPEKQRQIWALRRSMGEATKALSIYKEEDTVVPRARLPELVEAIRDVCARHGLTAISYGHAGDGNLHVNILKMDLSDERWEKETPVAIAELFRRVVALGGMITGEHGVGCTQRDYLPIAVGPVEIALMRRLKQAFDPAGILNPGKIFPSIPSA